MTKRMLLLPLALATLLLAAACSDDDNGNSPADTAGTAVSGITPADAANTAVAGVTGAIDTEAILGSVDDVKALVQRNAQDLDPEAIQDVDFADGDLTVTLAPSQDNLDASGLESACEDVFSAIALPDLSITVEKSDGSETAQCGGGA